MLLKHHEKTQELEYRQQKSVHQLREEQVMNLYIHMIINCKYNINITIDLSSPLADKQATRHGVAQSKRLYGPHQEGAGA